MQKNSLIQYCNPYPFMTVQGCDISLYSKTNLTDLEIAELILRTCSSFYNVTVLQIKAKGAPRGILKKVRQVSTALILKYTKITLKKTGHLLNCDHSTVIFRRDTVNDLCDIDLAYRAEYSLIKGKIEKMIINNN
jgi:chromosomal replication initiation ATPase DnaA